MPDEIMRAAFVTAPGPASDIQVGTLPIPTPGPTDVLVEVDAAAVNQVDTYVRSGAYPTSMPIPFVVGRDLVGTVTTAGPGSGFRVGERVWCNSLGHAGRQGSCAEYAVVPGERLYRLPEGLDPVPTVAALHPGATAVLALHEHARVRPGETIVIGGAAGSIGAIAVQLAREAGLRVVATARPDDHDRLRELGASDVVDYRDPDVIDHLRSVVADGADVYWDTSGQAQLAEVAPLLAPRARVVVTAGRGQQAGFGLWPFYTREVRILGFVISLATVAELDAAARTLNRRLAGPGLAIRVAHELPLAETARGHALVEQGTRGRVVIRPRR
jgi:2-desacetyl-2-hydroxyethyl bacteriochlorophyllide A dehydrogenase